MPTASPHLPPADRAGGNGSPSRAGRAPRRYDTRDLFGSDAEIEIIHHEGVYRLKITRQGKLILNK